MKPYRFLKHTGWPLTFYWPGLRVNGITLWPFVVVSMPRPTPGLMNHERIHLRQQRELLVLPFYVWYVAEFLWHRFRGRNAYDAYHAISFEKEAYARETDLSYLDRRPVWAFLWYLRQK